MPNPSEYTILPLSQMATDALAAPPPAMSCQISVRVAAMVFS
ncbi:hypothetical protein [Acetobacterium fimetarium]|nr:hypothetical protein [Acetobacterium fimetarium]